MRSANSMINQVVLENVECMTLYQTVDNLSHLFRLCPFLHHLELATITKTKSVHDLCVVIEAGYLSELITLDLQYSRITDRNVRFLCEALQSGNCSKLRTLRLSNNAMSVAGCGSLATCLSLGCLQELRSLDLQHNLLFAGGINKLGRSFLEFHCRNLQRIDFSRCHMANPGLRFLCEALNSSPLVDLRSLRIYWNSITAGGMKSLALTISLGILDSLELLDLSKNNIGAKGMNRLAESVLRGHHLPHLRVLIVHCVDTWYSVT